MKSSDKATEAKKATDVDDISKILDDEESGDRLPENLDSVDFEVDYTAFPKQSENTDNADQGLLINSFSNTSEIVE